MKLFTEEQVKQMIEKSRETGLTAEYLILTTHAIELPSDEEIEEQLQNIRSSEYKLGKSRGIVWVIDKIKNQQ